MTQKFYITSPIYYVNDVPHIGHAYTSIACDVLARFKRLMQFEVKFLTGTDEHGQKVEKAALARNLTPQEFTDQIAVNFQNLSKLLNLSNDDFIRTSETRHKEGVLKFWQTLLDSGDIYLDKYSGWYSIRDEAFYLEKDLIDGKAPTGAPVEWLEEPSYFFKLSAFEQRLLEFYEKNPGFISPESRKNEVINFVKQGLTDLSVSRCSFEWGIKIPNDKQHVIYVWLDALTNYLTALDYQNNSAAYQKFWPADVHIVGKDILRFHAIYWPAFLMAAGLELPKQIFAHGWWKVEGEKMSKSLGNVVDPEELINSYGIDQTRYFLMREIPFGQDGNFARSAIKNRINSELVNNIGNLAQRTLVFINKNSNMNDITPIVDQLYQQEEILSQLSEKVTDYINLMNQLKFNQALDIIIEIAVKANIYIDHEAPWKLLKNDVKRMNDVLFAICEALRYVAVMLLPFTPTSMEKLLDLLGVDSTNHTFNFLNKHYPVNLSNLPKPEIIFPRID